MNDVIARRAGRIAFGVVLLAGVAVLVDHVLSFRLYDERPFHAWHIVVATWLGALVISAAVTAFVALLPRPRDPDALRRAALAVPSVGVALALPITIHMPFTLAFFDAWCTYSMLFVSHVHIMFALLVLVRANALTGTTLRRPPSLKLIYLVCVGLALLPALIPAVLVAVTGIPFLYLLKCMETVAARDRDASRDIPFAIARTA